VNKSGQDDSTLFDIYVYLAQKPKKQLLIPISKKSTMQNLLDKILEDLQMLDDEYKGLRGM
jgi:hypothetical protein